MREAVAGRLLAFWQFFRGRAGAAAGALSVRDLLAWAGFVAAAAPAVGALAAYAHGAHLALLDGVGLGLGVPAEARRPALTLLTLTLTYDRTSSPAFWPRRRRGGAADRLLRTAAAGASGCMHGRQAGENLSTRVLTHLWLRAGCAGAARGLPGLPGGAAAARGARACGRGGRRAGRAAGRGRRGRGELCSSRAQWRTP